MSGESTKKKTDYFSIFLMIACIALAVLVVLLARENRNLKAELNQLALQGNDLAVGDMVDPPTLVDDTGQEFILEFGKEKTLLLVFSSQCPACQQTIPVWNEVMPRFTAKPSLQVVGIQTDRLEMIEGPEQLVTTGFPYAVHGIDFKARTTALMRIPYIPAMVLLDRDGTVAWIFIGMPDEAALNELAALL